MEDIAEKYKAIIFDFFGVISSEILTTWFDRNKQAAREIIKEKYMSPTDKGDMSQDIFFSELATVTHMNSKEVEKQWFSYVRINQELIAYIEELKKNYKIGLLSNAPSKFIRDILNEHTFDHLFDAIVVSSEVHYIKPEPEIYRHILKDLNVPAKDALFVDDKLINVEGARRVGMQGIVYTSVDQLRIDMRYIV